MLLRGVDGLFMWSPSKEAGREIALLHPVYAEALEYREFLDRGTPITFDVPKKPAPVVSGLRLGNRVLLRRTEFGKQPGPVQVKVDGKALTVPETTGRMQLLTLD
jgi:hypothetical protein